MPVKLAVFDIAGTTVLDDNNVAKAFQKAFEENGIEIRIEDATPLMGYHKPLAIQLLLEQKGVEPDADLIEEIHDAFEKEMVYFYRYAPDVRTVEGAEEIFEKLKAAGIRIALNTGFSRNVADAIVERFQWKEKGLIDDFIASNEVEKGRPFPYMIEQLMLRSGLTDPKEVAKIGDTAVDIEEGKNAGCQYVIAVTWGAGHRDELERMAPSHLIADLMRVPEILAQ